MFGELEGLQCNVHRLPVQVLDCSTKHVLSEAILQSSSIVLDSRLLPYSTVKSRTVVLAVNVTENSIVMCGRACIGCCLVYHLVWPAGPQTVAFWGINLIDAVLLRA
jgi:hypothetical protein